MNWLDWLDWGLRQKNGRVHQVINAGLCGDTVRGLLRRWGTDVVPFDPGILIITIGGNDSHPDSGIDPDEYEDALRKLVDAASEFSSGQVILQTYFGVDLDAWEQSPGDGKARCDRFLAMMDRMRAVAGDTDALLLDQHAWWEPFRQTHPARYQTLMQDPLHVNARGQLVMGLFALRFFGVEPAAMEIPEWRTVLPLLEEFDRCAATAV